ncbi:MAG: MopE-related protein [Myxococcota bacterium]
MISALLLLSSANAYELYGDDWSWDETSLTPPVLLDAGSFPPSTGSEADIEQAVMDGLDAWNGVGDLTLHLAPDSAAWPEAGSIRLAWDPTVADGAVVATASAWGYGGTMIDCEVSFWAGNEYGTIDWATVEDPWQTDLAEVTTHEVGHCLGFAHSNDWGAIMRPVARGWRGLDDDDEDGLVAMYPPCPDADADGYACDDCDDTRASVHPGAIEACNGLDDDCDGAIDAIGTSTVGFGSTQSTSAERTGSSWLTLFDVQADAAIQSFTQSLVLDETQWVSFTVLDVTPGLPRTRTVRVAQMPAGSGPVQSPDLGVPLQAGHRYAIGAGVAGAARYPYAQGTGAAAHGLVPVGARWESYAPGLQMGDQPHGASQPHVTLRLTDPDSGQVCASTGPVTPPGGDASGDGGSSGGCGSATLLWFLPDLDLLARRRQ